MFYANKGSLKEFEAQGKSQWDALAALLFAVTANETQTGCHANPVHSHMNKGAKSKLQIKK